MKVTNRRSTISVGLVALGAALVVSSLAAGNSSALSTPSGTGSFDLQNSTANEGGNCTTPGWQFEATGTGTLKSITLNAATGVDPITTLNASSHFVELPAGKSLSDLSTTGSTASIQYPGSDSSVTSFALASVCSPSAPPTTAPPTTVTPTTAPPTTAPPTTAPPTTVTPTTVTPTTVTPTTVTPTTVTPTTQPPVGDTTTTIAVDSEGVAPTTTSPAAVTETSVAQLAVTGLSDRMIIVFGLLLVALGSVLYLVSRPAETY
jgi:hypothetical protein